jgi:WD40 repeat protein
LQVEIWDLSAVAKIGSWQFGNSIFDLSWHPAGTYLAIAGAKGVRLWTPPTPILNAQQVVVATASLNLAWSPDGRYLAAGNLDRTLTIIDLLDPSDPWTLHGCSGKIRQLAWLAGTTAPCLAVASDREIALWELTVDLSNWEGCLLDGHQDRVLTLAPHPHLPILASGGADGYLCLWSVSGEIEGIIADDRSQITSVDWHPDGVSLIAGNRAGKIELWSIPA